MIKKSKLLILFLFFIVLISSVSAIGAADSNATDVQMVDGEDVELEQTDSNQEPIQQTNTSQDSILTDSPKSYCDLNRTINNNNDSFIVLDDDYTYDNDTDSAFLNGIVINRNLTIDGNGRTINGNSKANGIFASAELLLKNIRFINCGDPEILSSYDLSYGGSAVDIAYDYEGIGFDVEMINCTFDNCCSQEGGAVYGGVARNCTFSNCRAKYGGATFDTTVYNCRFLNNHATCSGGATEYSSAYDCYFEGNVAEGTVSGGSEKYGGGAMLWGSCYNCTFVGNSGKFGGALYLSGSYMEVVNSTFKSNSAGQDGGAIYVTDNPANILDCSFEQNRATHAGGAIYSATSDSTIVCCRFNGNTGVSPYANTYKCVSRFPTFSVSSSVQVYYPNASVPINMSYSYKYYQYNRVYYFNGIDVNIQIYKGNQFNASDSCLSGSRWNVDLPKGTYKIYLYAFDNSVTKSFTLSVNGYKTVINASDLEIKVGNTTNITATLIEDYSGTPIANKNLTVVFNGNSSTLETDKNGQIHIHVPALPAKSYEVSISFNEDDLYDSTSKNINVLIDKIDTRLLAGNVTAFYNEGKIIAKLVDESGKPLVGSDVILTVSYLPSDSLKTNRTGEIEYSLAGKGLAVGNHDAKIEFIENETHKGSNISINVNLYRLKSTISVQNISFVYGESGIVTAYLNDSNGDPIANYEVHLLMMDGSIYELRLTDSNGRVEFDLSDRLLLPGTFEGNIHFETTNRYIGTSVPVNVTVNKVSTEISAPDMTCMYGEGKYLVVTLKDKYGNPVFNESVSVKSTIKTLTGKTDGNGQARFLIDLPPKSYSVAVIFSGNTILDSASSNANVIVTQINERISTVISAGDLVSVYNEGKYMTITLMDDYGDALSGRDLSINFNGKTKTYKTDSKGQVKLSAASLVPKKYQAKIIFFGDSKYQASSFTVNLVVKKANPYLFVSKKKFNKKTSVKKYKVTLKTNKNVAMKNVKISLKVKGKTYVVKTNKNGQAIFKLKGLSKKGTYKAVVTYKGNSCYNKVVKNAKITVR